ncbi:type II toxin-antitoxin system VapC family toxin [Thalassospira tepidiphila]|uniref:type II toxin-antitoxin system VapC family toxin n=1 Tax=Thalassospira tepidiphila TaxID=393657 RepID=UPI003AA9BD9D
MLKLVWDSSAIVSLRESDERGYSPAYSLWRDLSDNLFADKYLNIIPSIAFFEFNATASAKNRNNQKFLHELYILGDHEEIYPIDENLISKSSNLVASKGFDRLRGADLIFACIAKIENAYLVTLDKAFRKHLSEEIKVIDLNDSKQTAAYRNQLLGGR